MNLCDVNILVRAFRQDAERHQEYREWVLEELHGDAAFAASEQVFCSLIRIATHPRIFKEPSARAEVVRFTDAIRLHPLCRLVRPSAAHWPLFLKLCDQADARANLVTDCWLAAIAIESGCVLITADRDFARFPGLRWRHPLDHQRTLENPR